MNSTARRGRSRRTKTKFLLRGAGFFAIFSFAVSLTMNSKYNIAHKFRVQSRNVPPVRIKAFLRGSDTGLYLLFAKLNKKQCSFPYKPRFCHGVGSFATYVAIVSGGSRRARTLFPRLLLLLHSHSQQVCICRSKLKHVM